MYRSDIKAMNGLQEKKPIDSAYKITGPCFASHISRESREYILLLLNEQCQVTSKDVLVLHRAGAKAPRLAADLV